MSFYEVKVQCHNRYAMIHNGPLWTVFEKFYTLAGAEAYRASLIREGISSDEVVIEQRNLLTLAA